MSSIGKSYVAPLILGITLAFVIGGMYLAIAEHGVSFSPHDHTEHEVGKADNSDEEHVHSDIAIYLSGARLDLSADQYQSNVEQILHPNFHFHDNNDQVLHRHAADLSLATFLDSLGYTLTDTCLTSKAGEAYCTDDTNVLRLYVNGVVQDNPMTYVPKEEDQILLYYGDPESGNIDTLLSSVSNDACIYSGTCPERGTPPPESCGLSCEI